MNNEDIQAIKNAVRDGIREAYNAGYLTTERATGHPGRSTGVSIAEAKELDALWQQHPDSKHGYPTKWEKLEEQCEYDCLNSCLPSPLCKVHGKYWDEPEPLTL